ncbi:hypothetical protein OEZ49_02935 [Ruegeria sp. WL0004]|uniref:Major facilitator superfamily (MFS) profile domain-containing protein n=1 Tax=Ruegeria marisflavi TaxID=2984152 RepID=A0ABT2WLD4_9RHOB|nr:hypothetical protein [Ruegeria sp. WL0004]MCU9836715.1 hypothetical protein [Ruegeria sp. WL0004]
MAWVGIVLGTLAGLVISISACVFWELPFWAGLLLYPAIGSSVAISVILVLFLRGEHTPDADPISDARTVAG